jgi:REP element-mobilizing transposase RayT
MRAPASAPQRSFELRTWGGVRRGAGPKLRRPRPGVAHRARPELRPWQPVHVTLRVLEHVWNLRSERSYAIVHAAVEAVRRRHDFRVVHFSTQGNHLHGIVEANGAGALAAGMRALSIRIARGLNAMMGRSGPVYEDRYHAHVLRTPAEVRNAVRYVLGNYASHARRRGEPVRAGFVDRFSSASAETPRAVRQASLWPEPPVRAPETWLLRTAGPRGV